MRAPTPITIDFETHAIEGRPSYPPIPVGVSIQKPGHKPVYHAWGHQGGNNIARGDAARIVQDCFSQTEHSLLFHNAKFDVDVAVTHLGCRMPAWDQIHDTLYLLFLHNPYANTFSLKPSADALLGMPPTEQDAVRQWLVDHGVIKPKDRKWGAHISKAPGDIVGRYAKGDVIRTFKLFKKLWPEIAKRGMLEAYDRERQLMPILLENETGGICVDHNLLRADTKVYQAALIQIEHAMRRKLKVKELDFNSAVEVADVLESRGVVTEWQLTKTGKRSTAKKFLTPDKFNDPRVWQMLGYRNRLAKCLNTYMEPWLRTAELSGGKIYVGWNQVRQSWAAAGSADAVFGARTGRPSTSPNLLAVTKSFYDKGDGFVHPGFVRALPQLPTVRSYILPDKGERFVHRDYNQQELRILAHFEDGDMCSTYNANPRIDIHSYVRDRIEELTGIKYERRHIKTLNFGMLYGMGIKRLGETLKIDPVDARQMKNLQRRVLSGLPELEWHLKRRAADDEYIRTWGGREYYCEPPKIIINDDGDEVTRTFEYKLLNYLIQGSAADATKQALINYHNTKRNGRFLLTVYDEINISVPAKAVKSEMKILKTAMETVKFDVPMITDAKVGMSWSTLQAYKE